MEAAVICKVAVSAAPYAIDKPYDYLVPEAMMETAVPGVRVMVPFGRGNRSAEGMVLTRGTGVRTKKLKPLTAVLDREPVLDRAGIELALWMRQRYFCTLFEAVKTILPTGLWYQLREVWKLTNPQLDRLTADSMAASVRRAVPVLDVLYAGGGSADLLAALFCRPKVEVVALFVVPGVGYSLFRTKCHCTRSFRVDLLT